MIKRFRFGDAAPDPAALRAVLCTTVDGSPETILIEWFDHVPDGDADVLAHEHVLRGTDWLEDRWRVGGPRLKHMALAARAPGLTAEEFSERWRGRAGKVGATPIPEVAKGQAYAQNHPLPGEWAYDAVNEVWFDDEPDLRARIAFFAELGDDAEDDLVGEHRFVAVREELL